MNHFGTRIGLLARAALICAALCINSPCALAETQNVIDPTATPEAAPEPASKPAAPSSTATPPPQSDAAIKRERARAAAEQRRREKAEARALAAEKEAERLRAAEAAREEQQQKAALAAQAAAAKQAAAKAAAARQAAAKAAAVRDAVARANAAKEAEARLAAARDEAARELAARQAAEKEAAAREAAAKEAAARELAAREAALRAATRPGLAFRDCPDCPEMVWLPKGDFNMGETSPADGPPHTVSINYPLAVGRFEITFAEWDVCVAENGCRRRPDDAGWGRGRQPVINVSWVDAQQYVAWLSAKTGKRYRLLTEAEWEYAARGGARTKYWWGDEVGNNRENCYNCGSRWDGRRTAPVGSFAPNAFGLYDVLGNVSEWVEDCYHIGYRDAPSDGSAWTQNCTNDTRDERVMRGGAWQYPAALTRSAFRTRFSNGYYDFRIGFRIARTG